jgi:hypothetical protein
MTIKTLTLGAALAGMMLAPAAMAEDSAKKAYRGGGGPEKMYEALDANKDGKVSLEEFLAPHNTRFTEIDTNKDGFLSQEEMKTHHDAMREKWKEKRGEMKDKRGGADKPAEKPAETPAE